MDAHAMESLVALVLLVLPAAQSHGRASLKYELDPQHHSGAEDELDIRLGDQSFCAGTMCFSQEECCKGTACVRHSSSEMGLCAKLVSQPEGKLCLMGAKKPCAGDMICIPIHNDFYPIGLCSNFNRVPKDKKYFAPCEMTLDCDLSERLCCRKQTPGHMQQRRICSYYDSPLEDCVF